MRKGQKASPETRLKMRMARLGKPSPHKGYKMSDEQKEKLRVIFTGRKHSEETKEKCRQITLNLCKDPEFRKKISKGMIGHSVSGETRRKISIGNSKEKSPHWKGGRWQHKSGYIMIRVDGHPESDRDRYVEEHRIIMEKHIGRPLRKDEIVHHINEIRNDNRIENLELMTRSSHMVHHNKTLIPNVKKGVFGFVSTKRKI